MLYNQICQKTYSYAARIGYAALLLSLLTFFDSRSLYAQCPVPAKPAVGSCTGCSAPSNSNETIASGQTRCFNSGNIATVTLEAGGVMRICGNVSITNLNVATNALQYATIEVVNGSNLIVRGSLNANQGLFRLVNDGAINILGDDFRLGGGLSALQGQEIHNYGTITTGLRFRLENGYNYFYNVGTFTAGDIVFPGSATPNQFVNLGQVNATEQVRFEGSGSALCAGSNSCFSTKDIISTGQALQFGGSSGIVGIIYSGDAQINSNSGNGFTTSSQVQICRKSSASGEAIDSPDWGSAVITDDCPYVFCNELIQALPVEIMFVRAQWEANRVQITWATATEKDNAYFTVERSVDARNFIPVADLPGAGSTLGRRDYSLTDIEPYPGVSYYRLKQTDTNGQAAYSKVVAVEGNGQSNLVIYPNPARTLDFRLYVTNDLTHTGAVSVQVQDIMGRLLLDQAFTPATDGSIRVTSSAPVMAGMYFVTAAFSNKIVQKPLVIQP